MIQAVSNSVTLMEMGMLGLFHRCSNFQRAVDAIAFRLFRSLAQDPSIEPKYPKLFTWFMGFPVHFEWRMRFAIDGHVVSFWCADDKAKIWCYVGGTGEQRLGYRH